MRPVRMHADQVDTDVTLVQALLSSQLPALATVPVRPVPSWGTDHDIYRVGGAHVVRLPKVGWATAQAHREARWLPQLAPHLPLAVPVPVHLGRPEHGYPFDWSVCEWLPGRAAGEGLHDLERAACDLAAFVLALRAVPTAGAHVRARGSRGAPLEECDEQVRRSLATLAGRHDDPFAAEVAVLERLWDDALAAPACEQPPTWVHGDLLPGNLLVVEDRLSAVIDWGGLNVGDPAVDLQPAWNVLSGSTRELYRDVLGSDDATWRRGRGWVVYQGVTALAYYRGTNPGIVAQAERGLREVVAEAG